MTRFFRLSLLLSLVLFFVSGGKSAYARLPHLHLIDPYFSQANDTTLWLKYRGTALDIATLNTVDFTLNYAINENLNLGFDVPYHIIFNTSSGGILGDIGMFIKMSLARSAELKWRLIAALYVKVGTAPYEEDSARRLDNGYFVSYYPFATGTHQMIPAIQFSFLAWDFLIAASVLYISENDPGDSLFYLEGNLDRFDFQLFVDYFFKFQVGNLDNEYLGFRPTLYINYQLNVSPVTMYPDAFFSTLELNFKWKEKWRFKTFITVPIWSEEQYYRYEIGLEAGKVL